MLDKKTEEVLRFIHSKHQAFSAKGYSVYLTSDKLGIEHPELRSICEYLRSIGFINCTFSKTVNQITASITREGIRYLEEKELTELQQQELLSKEEQRKKEQRQHEYRLTLFNIIGGGIAGLITSLIFWLITK